MPTNLEIKVRVPSLAEFRRRLTALPHCQRLPVQWQCDRYFLTRRGYLKLRIVSDGGGELIFYERPRRCGACRSHYSRWPVADPRVLLRLLTGALGIDAVVRKAREVFLLENARVHLDRVAGLGTFVEIEVVVERGAPQAERLMQRILKDLRTPAASTSGSYRDLLRRQEVAYR